MRDPHKRWKTGLISIPPQVNHHCINKVPFKIRLRRKVAELGDSKYMCDEPVDRERENHTNVSHELIVSESKRKIYGHRNVT